MGIINGDPKETSKPRKRAAFSNPHTREWLTLDQVTQEWPIPKSTLRTWIADGRLEASKPGKRVIVKRANVVRLIESKMVGGIRKSAL